MKEEIKEKIESDKSLHNKKSIKKNHFIIKKMLI